VRQRPQQAVEGQVERGRLHEWIGRNPAKNRRKPESKIAAR
jgi:hypothetical protein